MEYYTLLKDGNVFIHPTMSFTSFVEKFWFAYLPNAIEYKRHYEKHGVNGLELVAFKEVGDHNFHLRKYYPVSV